jgi:phosphoenolpyruvate carboxylase
MRSYIVNKIEQCKIELMHALDSNDYMSAIKLRAVQKEFEELLSTFETTDNAVTDAAVDVHDFYTTSEAAAVLGVHPTSVTRRAAFLHGQKINGSWHFPKDVIDEEEQKTQNKNRPGRKPQK